MASILAGDDAASMRQFVRFALGKEGLDGVQAVDGEDTPNKARENQFELVLTDQHMPRPDVIGLTQGLHQTLIIRIRRFSC